MTNLSIADLATSADLVARAVMWRLALVTAVCGATSVPSVTRAAR